MKVPMQFSEKLSHTVCKIFLEIDNRPVLSNKTETLERRQEKYLHDLGLVKNIPYMKSTT